VTRQQRSCHPQTSQTSWPWSIHKHSCRNTPEPSARPPRGVEPT